jgi:hypothetical protein
MTSAFQQYQSGALDGKDVPGQEEMKRPAEPVDHTQYIEKAKVLVAHDFNETFFPREKTIKTSAKDFYVVWFAKTLGNWKALVSTDVISGQYWEVTHNGEKRETYVDHYVKRHNQAVPDSAYEGLVAQNARMS